MGARRSATASFLTDSKVEDGRYVAPSARYSDVAGSAIQRAGTMNGLATGQRTFVAAGYSYWSLDSSPYSSSGPTRGARNGPDYACMTDRSPVTPGVRATGVLTGTKARLIGTSTAAPQLGRQIVNNDLVLLAKQPFPFEPLRVGAGCLVPDPGLLSPK